MSVKGLYIHKIELEPVALPQQNIVFIPKPPPQGVPAWRVAYVEPWEYTKDFGTLDAKATKKNVEVKDLEQDEETLAQVRFAPIDDFLISVAQPRKIPRLATLKITTEIGLGIWQRNPTLSRTEFFVFEKGVPYLTLRNPTAYKLGKTRVYFAGFVYKLERLDAVPEKYMKVPYRGPGK